MSSLRGTNILKKKKKRKKEDKGETKKNKFLKDLSINFCCMLGARMVEWSNVSVLDQRGTEDAAPGSSQRIPYIFRLSTYALDCGKNYFGKVI